MLSHQKRQEVIALLRQGLSRQKIVELTGVSKRSIYNIEHDLHRPKEKRPARCTQCGHLVTLPCRICKARQELRPGSSPTSEPGHLPTAMFGFDLFGLDLHGEVEERYLEMHRKVHAEIAAGTRTPGQYARPSSGIYD